MDSDEKEWEIEPALVGSLTDWFTVEAHGHIEKVEGESASYESTALVAMALAGIASYASDTWMLALNVIAEREVVGGAGTDWGYAMGVRRGLL